MKFKNQPVHSNSKFDLLAVKKILMTENKFIENLLSILPIPVSSLQGQLPDEENDVPTNSNFRINGQKTRAQSLTELHSRLQNIQSKKNLNYKDKLVKQGLKNRLKKKTKKEKLGDNKKLIRMQKLNKLETKAETNVEENGTNTKATKPVYNKEGKMVFSKFDFSGVGAQKEKKGEKDPKKILKNLEKQKVKFAELEAKGEKDKVIEIKQKQAWRNALAKSEGEKVKDDPILLKKSIKKREQIRKGSEKKWQTRQDGVEKAKDMRQAKRTENIDKRKKDKKHKKLKQAVKRGKVIPGF